MQWQQKTYNFNNHTNAHTHAHTHVPSEQLVQRLAFPSLLSVVQLLVEFLTLQHSPHFGKFDIPNVRGEGKEMRKEGRRREREERERSNTCLALTLHTCGNTAPF